MIFNVVYGDPGTVNVRFLKYVPRKIIDFIW